MLATKCKICYEESESIGNPLTNFSEGIGNSLRNSFEGIATFENRYSSEGLQYTLIMCQKVLNTLRSN